MSNPSSSALAPPSNSASTPSNSTPATTDSIPTPSNTDPTVKSDDKRDVVGTKRQRTNTAGDHTPARSHHRIRSSGEIDPEDIPQFVGIMDNILHMFQRLRAEGGGKWETVEDVQSLQKQAIEIMKQVRAYDDFVKKDHGKDVKVISFSKITLEIMEERLGFNVIAIVSGADPEMLSQRLFSILASHAGARDVSRIQAAVNNWDLSSLRSALLLIHESINTTSEAGCRMIIDNWIIQSMLRCKSISGLYRSLLFPELHISGVDREIGDLPAKIEYKDCITYIPGTTDYALWTVPPSNIEFHPYDQQAAVNGANNIKTLTLFTPHDTITLYEAKRKNKSLADHIPQVVAECIAFSIRKSTDPNNASDIGQIPFGLTSGNQWIFGVVDKAERRCWRTDELTVDVKKGDDCLRAMMGIMLLRSIQPGAVLKHALTAIVVPTTSN